MREGTIVCDFFQKEAKKSLSNTEKATELFARNINFKVWKECKKTYLFLSILEEAGV